MKRLVGWFGRLFVQVQEIFFCLGCSSRPGAKYFFPHRTSSVGSRAASPVYLYVSLSAIQSFPGRILEHMFSVQDS